MTTALLSLPIFRAFDSAGLPLAGGLLYSYAAGTTTAQNTYSDSAGASPNTNPVVMDSTGTAVVRLDPALSYKFVLKTSTGTTLWTVDNYSALYLYSQTSAESTAGVVPTSLQYPEGDLFRYGAIGNGSVAGGSGTNDAAVLSTANSVGVPIIVGHGNIFRIGTNTTLTAPLLIDGGQLSIDNGVTLTLNGPLTVISASTPFVGPGVVHYSTTSRPGRLSNILPDRSGGVTVRGSGQYYSFGDSYTAGTGATVATRYSAILASNLNLTENNNGVSGRGVTRATLQGYTNLPKYGSRGQFITWMAGFNDLHYQGGNAKTLVKITSETKAFLANCFLKVAVPANDATVTATGTWNPATVGVWGGKADTSFSGASGRTLYSNTLADKLSYTFTGTNVVVGYYQGSNTTYTLSTFDVYIDSVFVETISPNNTTDGNVGFPEVYENLTHAVLFYPNLGTGSHTIEVRKTGSGYTMVDYFGTLAAPGDCPSVMMSEIPHVNVAGYASPESNRTKTIDDAGSAAIRTGMEVFRSLGYPIAWVPINDYYDYQANMAVDNDHPNPTGHAQIANGFQAYVVGNNWNSPPSCTFTKSATQSIANNTTTAVTFSAAVDDFHGFRDTVNTSRVNAVQTGTMRLSGNISFAANATGIRACDVYKSNSLAFSLFAYPGFAVNDNITSFSADIAVAAGDYVELRVSQNSGGALNLQTNCRLDVAMIR